MTSTSIPSAQQSPQTAGLSQEARASLTALVGELASRDRWSPEQVAAHQREALASLVRHAAERSPYYRDALGPDAAARPLHDLPVLTKSVLMDHYDDVVTDPRLRLDAVDAHLASPDGHRPFAGEFELFTTSGTTGTRGVFAYSRDELRLALAASLRALMRVGARPGLRLIGIGSPSPMFMSRRIFAGLQAGAAQPAPEVSVTTPIPEAVAALNAFQPEALLGYPTTIALLAAEQQAGRLDIAPTAVATGSEVLTEDHAARIQDAWGVRPGNAYVATEACPIASSCSLDVGLHVAEDLVIIEVVDEDGAPTPPGAPGHRLLLTNLVNRTQPLIRYELTDSVTMAEGPNPAGLPWARIAAVDGRTQDILVLPGRQGPVQVHPHRLRAPLATFPEVVQYQFEVGEDRVTISVVTTADPRPRLAEAVAAAVATELDDAGVVGVGVRCLAVDRIEREPGGAAKLKQVKLLGRPAGAA